MSNITPDGDPFIPDNILVPALKHDAARGRLQQMALDSIRREHELVDALDTLKGKVLGVLRDTPRDIDRGKRALKIARVLEALCYVVADTSDPIDGRAWLDELDAVARLRLQDLPAEQTSTGAPYEMKERWGTELAKHIGTVLAEGYVGAAAAEEVAGWPGWGWARGTLLPAKSFRRGNPEHPKMGEVRRYCAAEFSVAADASPLARGILRALGVDAQDAQNAVP